MYSCTTALNAALPSSSQNQQQHISDGGGWAMLAKESRSLGMGEQEAGKCSCFRGQGNPASAFLGKEGGCGVNSRSYWQATTNLWRNSFLHQIQGCSIYPPPPPPGKSRNKGIRAVSDLDVSKNVLLIKRSPSRKGLLCHQSQPLPKGSCPEKIKCTGFIGKCG